MNFKWLDQFEAQAQRFCCIEREDSRDRGRSTGNKGGGKQTEGGAGSGGVAQAVGDVVPKSLQKKIGEDKRQAFDRWAGKTTEGGNTPQEQAAYRNDLMKKGDMNAYRRQAEIDATGQEGYTAGAVGNYPEADWLTVAEKIVAPLIPGVGGMVGMASAADAIEAGMNGESMSTARTVMGGDPGPQRGWAADRSKGATGQPDDARGNNPEEREIIGSRFGAGTMALAGDDATETDTGGDITRGSSDEYSDVPLRDRRKPRVGAGTQVLAGVA